MLTVALHYEHYYSLSALDLLFLEPMTVLDVRRGGNARTELVNRYIQSD